MHAAHSRRALVWKRRSRRSIRGRVLAMSDMGMAHGRQRADHGDAASGMASDSSQLKPRRSIRPDRRHASRTAAHESRRSGPRACATTVGGCSTYADLHTLGGPDRSARAGARARAARDRSHAALHLVVRRPQVLRGAAVALHLRRAAAHLAHQRHDDDAPDSPARHVERGRRRVAARFSCANTRWRCNRASRSATP